MIGPALVPAALDAVPLDTIPLDTAALDEGDDMAAELGIALLGIALLALLDIAELVVAAAADVEDPDDVLLELQPASATPPASTAVSTTVVRRWRLFTGELLGWVGLAFARSGGRSDVAAAPQK